MESIENFIAQKNAYGIVQHVRKGNKIHSWEMEDIISFFPLDEVKKILLELAKCDTTAFARESECHALFMLSEDIASEIFLKSAQQGGCIDYYYCEKICQKFSAEHARAIMLELNRHRNFFNICSENVKKVAPELVSL